MVLCAAVNASSLTCKNCTTRRLSQSKKRTKGWGEGEESAEGNAVGAGEMSAFVGFFLSPAPKGCPFANPHKSVQKTNRYKDTSPRFNSPAEVQQGRQP